MERSAIYLQLCEEHVVNFFQNHKPGRRLTMHSRPLGPSSRLWLRCSSFAMGCILYIGVLLSTSNYWSVYVLAVWSPFNTHRNERKPRGPFLFLIICWHRCDKGVCQWDGFGLDISFMSTNCRWHKSNSLILHGNCMTLPDKWNEKWKAGSVYIDHSKNCLF